MANDHYIPRFYLGNFGIAGRPGWIYTYHLGSKPYAVGIKSVASEEDFYTLKIPQVGIPQNAPDMFLQKVESQAALVIKRLTSAPKLELSDKEVTIIAVFVATLATRTPMARERAVNVRLAMRKKLLKDLAEDTEYSGN